MELVDPKTGIEVLTRDACLRLLADDVVGRLGVVDGDVPMIFPVNYVLDGDAVVVRTTHGTKLDRGTHRRACFEIDAFDRASRTGWSVVVSGRLEVVTAADPSFKRLVALPVDPWADFDKPHWLRLVPHRITGRRVHH
jgi:nitroimidazol reductase NimA-like FMN-containing flavoprotein (pyridoxamine 5'-phosphate oxidase superfamily)